jgi:hypothetical protein
MKEERGLHYYEVPSHPPMMMPLLSLFRLIKNVLLPLMIASLSKTTPSFFPFLSFPLFLFSSLPAGSTQIFASPQITRLTTFV